MDGRIGNISGVSAVNRMSAFSGLLARESGEQRILSQGRGLWQGAGRFLLSFANVSSSGTAANRAQLLVTDCRRMTTRFHQA